MRVQPDLIQDPTFNKSAARSNFWLFWLDKFCEILLIHKGHGQAGTLMSISNIEKYSYFVYVSPHKFEFSIRRNKRDCMLRFELAQFDTLVELAVINSYGTFGSTGFIACFSTFIWNCQGHICREELSKYQFLFVSPLAVLIL